ncbi:hypothetical protein OHQ88_24585 [Micromonospora zamorensis]|uniref:hypothetical protein n=1 Tax=Micromonospora zamorensis TaxID=709883 RepID=UPI002E23D906
MTIAISLKVNDGLVLGADSASTLVGLDPAGQATVLNVYKNANKVFNLRKGSPIGAVTWGAGAFGNSSIETLVKDFRIELASNFDPASYSIEEIARRFRKFMFEDHFAPAFKDAKGNQGEIYTGFIVAGYSSGAMMAEEYQIDMRPGDCPDPRLVRPIGESGMTWNGQPEAIARLILGFSGGLPDVLVKLGVDPGDVPAAMNEIRQHLLVPFVEPGMPFQDAIDLAEFLIDATVKFVRFTPGADTVGGPVDIAGITKHEGFKWIKRKHYYGKDLNPA